MEMVETTCYKDKNDRLHLSQFIIMLKSYHRKINDWTDLQSSQIQSNNLCLCPLSEQEFLKSMLNNTVNILLSFVTTYTL